MFGNVAPKTTLVVDHEVLFDTKSLELKFSSHINKMHDFGWEMKTFLFQTDEWSVTLLLKKKEKKRNRVSCLKTFPNYED